MRRWLLSLTVPAAIACGHREDTSEVVPAVAPEVAQAMPVATTPPPREPTPVPADASTRAATPLTGNALDAAMKNLDAMLDEINAHWRADHTKIYLPSARAGFTVSPDNGVPWLVATVPLPIATVARHLAKRVAKNASLKLYSNGSVDGTNKMADDEPVVLAFNDTLLMFVVPDPADSSLFHRVGVAKP